MKKLRQKYWYITIIWNCPLCGHQDCYRETRFTKKPIDPNERIEWHDSWDGCGDL